MQRHDKISILNSLDYPSFWENELAGRITSRIGVNWKARSPFREDRVPSFSVNIRNGMWNDFAGDGGDVFKFVMVRLGISFPDALTYIGGYVGNSHVAPSMKPNVFMQKNPAQEYPYGDFQFREIVEGPLSNRKAGRIQKGCFGQFLDLFGLPPKEAYLSAFLFSSPVLDYHKNPGTGNGVGSLAGYSGPVKASSLFFDFDCAEDPGKAQWELATLLFRLDDLEAYAPENIRIFFSGCKGFHVMVADADLERMPASEDMPNRVEAACRKLAGDLQTFDGSVYGKTRLLRAENSRHPKSGLYKIPLTLEEANDINLSIDDIRNMARQQRRIENGGKSCLA